MWDVGQIPSLCRVQYQQNIYILLPQLFQTHVQDTPQWIVSLIIEISSLMIMQVEKVGIWRGKKKEADNLRWSQILQSLNVENIKCTLLFFFLVESSVHFISLTSFLNHPVHLNRSKGFPKVQLSNLVTDCKVEEKC